MKKTVFFGLLIILLAFNFISCGDDNSNGDFISSTNETTLNNVPILGLVGTTASSSNTNVATVETPPTDKIKITSVSEGSAIITVSDGTNNATINVSVSKTGAVTIGTITKYSEQNNNPFIGTWYGIWVNAGEDISITINLNEDYTFVAVIKNSNGENLNLDGGNSSGTFIIDENKINLNYEINPPPGGLFLSGELVGDFLIISGVAFSKE